MLEKRQPDSAEIPSAPISRFMAETLGKRCGLSGDNRSAFKAIIGQLTTSLSAGHICIELSQAQRQIVRASPLVAEDMNGPLVLSGKRFYFGRYYRYECELAAALKRRAAAAERGSFHGPAVDKILNLVDDPHQKRAIEIALEKKFCIVSGGPGTGKTTLVVMIIRLLQAQYGSRLQIALAAPTGKAAMRLHESLAKQIKDGRSAAAALATGADLPDEAVTLHRLLGLGRFSNTAAFTRTNPLPYDVVIVDEASMVDLAMMAKLVRALKPEARLLLLGDRDQLASVESGAVLADCIDSLPENTATLKKSYRFSADIGDFAAAVREGDGERGWSLCSKRDGAAVSFAGSDWLEEIVAAYGRYMALASASSEPEAYPSLIGRFNGFRVLCALRRGRRGVEQINREVESRLVEIKAAAGREWYHGRPVIITRNDSSLGLFNGDIGICLPDPSKDGLRVWFESADSGLRSFMPAQLPAHETAWALTIHKSQGSEFDEVHVVLPRNDNPVLCRELLYTAVTRAKGRVRLVASEEICMLAIARKTDRHSGLAERLG